MMAKDNDMLVGIKLLLSTGRHVAHRNMLRTFNLRSLVLPGLTNIQKRKRLPTLLKRFDLSGRYFEVHIYKFSLSS